MYLFHSFKKKFPPPLYSTSCPRFTPPAVPALLHQPSPLFATSRPRFTPPAVPALPHQPSPLYTTSRPHFTPPAVPAALTEIGGPCGTRVEAVGGTTSADPPQSTRRHPTTSRQHPDTKPKANEYKSSAKKFIVNL